MVTNFCFNQYYLKIEKQKTESFNLDILSYGAHKGK